MAQVTPEPTMQVLDIEETPMNDYSVKNAAIKLPPLRANKVAPLDVDPVFQGPKLATISSTVPAIPPIASAPTIPPIASAPEVSPAVSAPVTSPSVSAQHAIISAEPTLAVDCEESTIKQPVKFYQNPAFLALPFVACVGLIILLGLTLYVTDWQKFSPVLVSTTTNPSSVVPSEAPETSGTTGVPITSQLPTVSLPNTEAPTSLPETASAESTTSGVSSGSSTVIEMVGPSTEASVNTTPSPTTTTKISTATAAESTAATDSVSEGASTGTTNNLQSSTTQPDTTIDLIASSSEIPSTTTTNPSTTGAELITSSTNEPTTISAEPTTTSAIEDTTTTTAPSTTTIELSTTTVEPTTSTDEPTTSTNEPTTTTVEPTTTSTEPSTTSTTETATTTAQQPNIQAVHGFVLSVADNFTAELLDPGSLDYHLLSINTCSNVSSLFDNSSSYQGCSVTAIEQGSVKISLSILFTYAPDTNLTTAQLNAASTLTNGLPALITNLNGENITQTEFCTNCSDITNLEANIASQAVDSCNISSPCSSNGTCVNGLDRYFCVCDEGFYGIYCEILTADCDRLLCNNNGICALTLAGDLLCECLDTHEGDNCDIIIQNATYPCSNFTTPCSDHGECFDLSETEYVCICEAGYNGTDCEGDIDDCAAITCFHGNCTDLLNEFNCTCDDGYEGIQCQTNTYDCTNTSCSLNGTCYDVIDGVICDCEAGFTGSDCHSICDDTPCYNNGTCSLCPEGYCEDTRLSFECDCPGDIYGVLCTDEQFPAN